MKLLLLLPLVLLCACAFAAEQVEVSKEQADKCRAEGGCKMLTMHEIAVLAAYIQRLENRG